MILEKYGLSLKRLKKSDFDEVILWKNSSFVRTQMFYQETITKQQHYEWFGKIDNKNNYYFVIHLGLKKKGLINLINIDPIKQTAEAGIFMHQPSLLNGVCYIKAFALILDFAFSKLNLKHEYSFAYQSNIHQTLALKMGAGIHYLEPNKVSITITRTDFKENIPSFKKIIDKKIEY